MHLCCQCPSHTFSNQPLMKMFSKGCRSLVFHGMCCKCQNKYLMRMFSNGYQTIMRECFIHLKRIQLCSKCQNQQFVDNILQGLSISCHPLEEGRYATGKLFTQLEPQNHCDFSQLMIISHKGTMTTNPESAFFSSWWLERMAKRCTWEPCGRCGKWTIFMLAVLCFSWQT